MPSAPWKLFLASDLYLSWPALSQISNSIFLSLYIYFFVFISIPIVAVKTSSNLSSQNLNIKDVFPTAVSPRNITLYDKTFSLSSSSSSIFYTLDIYYLVN